jgi:8-oxo-dGTP pyrophosphatase MutT (NUDIX family)
VSFLRMGVVCAAHNDENQWLFSQRGDLGTWNFPSGRLDPNERLDEAAVREAWEETGVRVEIRQPLGLYYYARWQRLNVLFTANVTGGEVLQKTYETRANGFYRLSEAPQPLMDTHIVSNLQTPVPHMTIIETPLQEYNRLRRRFALRWVQNLLAGHPEPRYPRFTVHASLLITHPEKTVLTLAEPGGQRVLPGIVCDGQEPPWEQIRRHVRDTYGLYELRTAELRWIGLYQHVKDGRIELIFAADLPEGSPLNHRDVGWTSFSSPAWWPGYRPFVQHVQTHTGDVLAIYEGS